MIIFENDGVVPIAAFTTFGMSAKPGSTNPIGKFGTGLKNAVAIVLRLGGTFRLWRGLEEYEFYTKDEDFRGQTFARVRMKRRKGILAKWQYEEMPFTTELGKHWKPWMAVRELEANCRDEENGSSTIIGTDGPLQYLPREGRTLIAIECGELEDSYSKLTDIFLDDARKPIYEDDRVRIYEGESNYLFYRGMRVTDLRQPSLYTYEMKSVYLTEDRTSQYSFMDAANVKKSLLACPLRDVVDKVVRKSEDKFEGTFDWDDKAPSVSHVWRGSLGYSGVSGRFKTLRDNLDYGISSTEDVSIELQAHAWARILKLLEENDDEAAPGIREQLVEAGWKDVEKPSEDVEDDVEEPVAVETAPLALGSLDDEIPF